jgi:hypothetical protein
MIKLIAIAITKIVILAVIGYGVYDKFGWAASLTSVTTIYLLYYIIELQHQQIEKHQKIANFLDYEFGEGYIDEENKLHKKGEPTVDLSKETYD